MKILLINTFETQGGAAIASKRLLTSLNKTGKVEAKLLVNLRQTNDESIYETADTTIKKLIRKYRFILEKIVFMFFEVSKKERFSFSTGFFGTNISKHHLVKEADILHLHWVNHSFLSHKNIRQLTALGKPVVVTMHDMWYFTGGCHHSRECTNFMRECGNCIFLKNPHPRDLSFKQRSTKSDSYSDNMTFVACSSWLANLARMSSLLQKAEVVNIPNPIDTNVFKQQDKESARKALSLPADKTFILYAAARVDDERKGYKYLAAALKEIFESDSELKKDLEVIVMGNVKEKGSVDFYFPTHFLGNLSDTNTIVSCYNAADIFVTPSLEENLPNTIIESMACGTPAVAFEIGGIPDIIDHKHNGYLAEYKNVNDLVTGISWAISQSDISGKCIEKVNLSFSENNISERFISLYESLL